MCLGHRVIGCPASRLPRGIDRCLVHGLAHLNEAVLYGLLVDYWAGKDLMGYDL